MTVESGLGVECALVGYADLVDCIVVNLLCIFLLQAQQSQIDIKRNQIKELEQEIALINSQIASSTRQRKNTLNTLALIRKKVAARKRLISRLDSDLASQRRELQSHQESLARLERTLDTLKANYKHLILTAYKNRDTRKWFLYLFASESIEQGYRRWVYLKEYCNSINAQGEKILQLQQETQIARKRTQLLLSATQEKQRAYTKELTQYQKDEKESAALDAKLAKEQKRLKADLAKKRREASNSLAKVTLFSYSPCTNKSLLNLNRSV